MIQLWYESDYVPSANLTDIIIIKKVEDFHYKVLNK